MALRKELEGVGFLRLEGVACLAAQGEDGITRWQ